MHLYCFRFYAWIFMYPSYVYYAIIGLTLIGLKQSFVTSQSQAGEGRQAIPACSSPIRGQGSQACFCSMHSADKLSQHAVTQSQKRDTRHTIPACKCRQAIPACSCPITHQGSQTCYPSMQLHNQMTNHKPGKPDILSQHA